MEVEFSGKKYQSDGVDVYRDGVKINTAPLTMVGDIKKIDALLVDDKIFYNGQFYALLTKDK